MDQAQAVLAAEEAPLAPQQAWPARSREHIEHPFLVFRVAALPAQRIQALKAEASCDMAARLHELEPQVASLVDAACEALAAAIGACKAGDRERLGLIDLKRDLFNRRSARAAAGAERWGDLLPADCAGLARRAVEAVNAYADLEAGFGGVYADELQAARASLRRLCLDSDELLRGLSFNAPSLASDLLNSSAHPQKFAGKRGRELDRPLFNYFMRATAKVSPLSWFTPVCVARWSSSHPEAGLSLGDAGVSARVELSRRRALGVMAALVRNLAFWGEAHPLQLNPTLAREGEAWRFLDMWAQGAGGSRTWGVNLPLAQLPASQRVDALIDAFRAQGATELSARELQQALDPRLFGGEPRRLAAFVAQAVRVGLLIPQLAWSDQDDAVGYLTDLTRTRLPAAAEALQSLAEGLRRFAVAPPGARIGVHRAISGAYEALCAATGAAPDADHQSPLLYEDCVVDGDVPAIRNARLRTVVDTAHRLSGVFPLLDYNHVVQSCLAGLFRAKYGAAGVIKADERILGLAEEAQAIAQRLTPLPLLEQAAELDQLSPAAGDLLRGKRALLTEWHEMLLAGGEAVLTDDFLRRHERAIPEAIRARPTSYTLIGQTLDEAGGPSFVLNRIYSGHSMLMSRFMRGATPQDVRAIGRYLARLAPAGARLTEVPGVFGFNANIHPRFVDHELALPGRVQAHAGTTKLPLSELSVRYEPGGDRLMFVTHDGAEAALHYFGFLNLMVLPAIYQLLGRNTLQGLIPDLWQELLFCGLLSPRTDTVLARTSYRGLVLSRRTHYFAPASLPDATAPEADFYRGLVGRLQRCGSADAEHFARLLPGRDDFFSAAAAGGESLADTTDFKPSYLSASVPLSVCSLQRKLARRPRGLLVQEALPCPGEAGMPWRGESHVCEVQFEIARTAEGSC